MPLNSPNNNHEVLTPSHFVPCVPESAPFTAEQRAYLNGFFAGLFSRAPLERQATGNGPATAKLLQPLTILFGSQTGNAETLARRAAREAGKQGFAATVFEMAQYQTDSLKAERNLLLITSTYGDGDPPDNAKAFLEFLKSNQAPRLPQLQFSVLALGDSNYPKFCECGKDFDQRLAELGAQCRHPRTDCDLEYEDSFQSWLNGSLDAFKPGSSTIEQPALDAGLLIRSTSTVSELRVQDSAAPPEARTLNPEPSSGYNRKNPFPATFTRNLKLNADGSAKDTRHFEIALGDSGLGYEAGDALGVMPVNCPELVEEIIQALRFQGDEIVRIESGDEVPLRTGLLRHLEITQVPRALLEMLAERSDDELLRKLSAPGVNGELTQFLRGREIIDLLLGFPKIKVSPVEFVSLLKKLQPRLYSISSSPKIHTGQVHLTVSIVRYESLGRRRKGVCSTFLAERAQIGGPVRVFVQTNKSFRPPADGSRPLIMVGPGTGVAPFRAFLQERRATGACGKSWLFFGEQHEQTDFLYREELSAMLRDRTLTRLDCAFSRDQTEKIYVQHRLLEHARELFAWLEEGAHFYVCGDATRMARDVDAALLRAIETASGLSSEKAAEYVENLKAACRYQRDVY